MATFLVDENLPPALAVALQRSGYDALHVHDLGLRGAPDSDILAAASRYNAILITQDGKFGSVARTRRTPWIIVIHLPQAVRTKQLIRRSSIASVNCLSNSFNENSSSLDQGQPGSAPLLNAQQNNGVPFSGAVRGWARSRAGVRSCNHTPPGQV